MEAKPYPLFDELYAKVSQKIDVPFDIKRICVTINIISQNMTAPESRTHYNEIAALIYHYAIIFGQFNYTVPYDGKIMVGGKGILYYITNLPTLLQQIIGQYIEDYS